MRSYTIPTPVEEWIHQQLLQVSGSSSQISAKVLAESIQKMSDFYLQHPLRPTPWEELWCQQAQLAYYFPLNFLRNLRVFEELDKYNFFENATNPALSTLNWFEFGAGLGPSLEAFLHWQDRGLTTSSLSTRKPQSKIVAQLYESSPIAKNLCQHRWQARHDHLEFYWPHQKTHPWPHSLPPRSLLVLSYSLTELKDIPEWIWSADSIIIIDPSTRDDGRRLLNLRAIALQKGYSVIAPCTHQEACPLLLHSSKDWCHDRFKFDRPKWLLDIENHLPFKNQTLTLSYLALQRSTITAQATNSPVQLSSLSSMDSRNSNVLMPHSKTLSIPGEEVIHKTDSLARVTGDFLNEKGKTRQLVCRNSEREFLTFIKKNSTPIEFFRGDLISFPQNIDKKGNELRPLLPTHKEES